VQQTASKAVRLLCNETTTAKKKITEYYVTIKHLQKGEVQTPET
jgi:hypothetical protein